MTLFGISLRKPTFNEITAATVMGVGLWIACLGLMKASGRPMDLMEAGAALLMMIWACLGVRMGINVAAGVRHVVANAFICATLLLAYQGAWAFATN
jgi:hypothetical protein